MIGLSGDSSLSSKMLAFVLAIVLVNSPALVVFGLKTTPGSPCTDVCGTTTNTTSSEIACLDQSYNQTSVGKSFKNCISCQLDSEFNDAETGESDVNWGLYNLRYAFSTCVFGSPDSISNVSSPCPVACDGVRLAVETDVKSPDTSNLDSWCESPSFADNVVNTCEFCYNLTTTQVYMANCIPNENLQPIAPPLKSLSHNAHCKILKPESGSGDRRANHSILNYRLIPRDMLLFLHPAPTQEGPSEPQLTSSVQPLERWVADQRATAPAGLG
ncbi:hypothetical protein DTO012A8_10091 [Penicillium roqueforti]|nr:hypothetical protein DTO012A8_10091 [Penicillium roqueforti]